MKIPDITSLNPLLSASHGEADLNGSSLPFAGLGFDLSMMLSRQITLTRRKSPCPAAPMRVVDMPMPAGRRLLARLNREIRGS